MKKILIVGAGAAGLIAAVRAAQTGGNVTLVEANTRVGQKLLKTGNGRCNFSNLHISPEAYNHPDFVRPVLNVWDCTQVRGFFEDLGLKSYCDEAGRVYPVSDTAASVVDVLRLSCRRWNVEVLEGFKAVHLTDTQVKAEDGRCLCAEAVIVTTGGGTKLLSGVGHRMVPFSPVLGPLATDTKPIRGLSGIRVKCALTLTRADTVVDRECGELLFRDYGVSGIAVFDLSRFAKSGDVLHIDLLPDMDQEQVFACISQYIRMLSWRGKSDMLTGLFHKRINEALIRICGTDVHRLAETIKDFALTVHGIADSKQAQLTRGGAAVFEFDPFTLRSNKNDALYAAGETLDIDGRCGGYNLHWAFASGLRAAECAV